MLKIAVIGYGYWGPNLVRNFVALEGVVVSCVCDSRAERLTQLQRIYPSIRVVRDPEEIFNSSDIDAVVIATPVSSHFPLAYEALRKGKHVLLEKPMTDSVDHANQLIEMANKKNLVLMVDHTFLYNDAIWKLKEYISKGDLGKIQYIDSVRINLGIFQDDINVVWDLATHDVAVINFLLDKRPNSVQAIGVCHTGTGIENLAYITLNYDDNLIVHLNCSWSSPVKIRQMLIGGSNKMVIYNDIEPTDKLKIYDYKQEVPNLAVRQKYLVDYRLGDVIIPKFSIKEPLAFMAEDFKQSILEGKTPVSDWRSGLEAVKILEMANRSIKQGGKELKIDLN